MNSTSLYSKIPLLLFLLIIKEFTISNNTYNTQIQEPKTVVNFSIKQTLHTVKGSFTNFEVDYKCLPNKISDSYINVKIPLLNITTSNKKRDQCLLSNDFFDAKSYPYITFFSTKIEKKSDTEYLVYGKLTIKNITKKIVLPFVIASCDINKKKIVLSSKTKINRNDFGVGTNYWPAKMTISEDVFIECLVNIALD